MGYRKQVEKSNETKAVNPKREEEQHPSNNPAESLSRLNANMAQRSDILTLQRTLGNRAVRRLIAKQSQPGDIQTLQQTVGNKVVSNLVQRHAQSVTKAEYTLDLDNMQVLDLTHKLDKGDEE